MPKQQVILQEFNFVLVGESVSEEELSIFEAEIGGTLAESYRRFLLGVNGGVPKPELKSTLPQLPYPILVFYELVAGYEGLRRMFNDFNGDAVVSAGSSGALLPIAGDSGDRQICLAVHAPGAAMYLISDEDPDEPIVEPLGVSFSQFVASLSQPPAEVIPMEVLASKTWAEVQDHIKRGGQIDSVDGRLSLLGQTIRCDKPELFERLMELGVDTTDAIEVAVLNNQLPMLKRLIAAGGDPLEALDLAVGPQREEMRQYLRSIIGKK